MPRKFFSLFFFLIGIFVLGQNQGNVSDSAMVVSARAEASKIGSEVMKSGGNAFDAMVATDFALAVCYPFAGNLGGGGFMVYRMAEGEVGSLDYREKAPMNAHRKMYQDSEGNIIPRLSLDGGLAIGVPGTVAGLYEAHQKFGSLPWSELVQPAIDLAENGFVITKKQAERLNWHRKNFQKVNQETIVWDKEWIEGERFKNPNLAKTLKLIQQKGKDGFYEDLAKEISVFIQNNGGIISVQDLREYEPVWRNPIQFNWRNYRLISMGPPSSGGVVLGQILKMIDPWLDNSIEFNSEAYVQLLVEAERRAYADRAFWLGDPDFVEIPINELISEHYALERMQNFNWEEASKSEDIRHGEIMQESMETTHYSIVDAFGNAVSVTTTLNGAYGSKLYHPNLGFFFNNEMDDFSAKPGSPNMFGLIGGEANAIEPGKRMLSSMTPTIAEKDGRLFLVLGSPGGSTIITTVLQNFLNVAHFGMSMQESVEQPRFHHQWLPDEILVEPNGLDYGVVANLKEKGYSVVEGNSVVIGKLDAILVLEDGRLEGGADPRGDDQAIGF